MAHCNRYRCLLYIILEILLSTPPPAVRTTIKARRRHASMANRMIMIIKLCLVFGRASIYWTRREHSNVKVARNIYFQYINWINDYRRNNTYGRIIRWLPISIFVLFLFIIRLMIVNIFCSLFSFRFVILELIFLGFSRFDFSFFDMEYVLSAALYYFHHYGT